MRVNAVRPGLIETDIHASRPARSRAAPRQRHADRPVLGTPHEVAEQTIVWLLSDAASYVIGALLDCAAGLSGDQAIRHSLRAERIALAKIAAVEALAEPVHALL
ncbi:SDR family oxidoreductase [Cupriavidus basilensis]